MSVHHRFGRALNLVWSHVSESWVRRPIMEMAAAVFAPVALKYVDAAEAQISKVNSSARSMPLPACAIMSE